MTSYEAILHLLSWIAQLSLKIRQLTQNQATMLMKLISAIWFTKLEQKLQNCLKKLVFWPDLIMEKRVETLPGKTCFVERVHFSISSFHFSTPSAFFSAVATWKCLASVFQRWKGKETGEGVNLAIARKNIFFLKLRKDDDRNSLFCGQTAALAFHASRDSLCTAAPPLYTGSRE